MDKGVLLLLLLSLQVFMLVTTFTSSDAAPVVTEDQPPGQVGSTYVGYSPCWRMLGGCGLIGAMGPGPTPARPEEPTSEERSLEALSKPLLNELL
ncbi:hypothetical protein OYC64_018151 [Pagothenia borchgrevinki]|uniref:Uncharacterized protein n=1 Tax=Pagothenia borchgrevinki TaxID=8213 RepID=A0ABD2GMS3_PAGBO